MDDLGGKPTIFGNIHVYVLAFACLQCQNLAQDVGKDKEGSYEASNAAEVAASSCTVLEVRNILFYAVCVNLFLTGDWGTYYNCFSFILRFRNDLQIV